MLTPTSLPGVPTVTPIPSPTPRTPPMPIPTPVTPLIESYIVQAGDTLGGISLAYDIPLDELMALNGIDVDSAIIQVGQTLHVPLKVSRSGPLVTLLPDSEVVYSPAYVEFDTAAFIKSQGGYLANYSEMVNGVEIDAAQIVDRVARQFSVGPRVLLALLEYYGGWVTNLHPTDPSPLGPACPYGDRLFLQLSWAANRVNKGYYGYKQNGSIAVQFRDRSRAIVPPQMNAGTVGAQNVLAVNSNWELWLTEVKADGPFMQTYRRLFGDPFAKAVEPLVPIDLSQPPLQLPWEKGRTFYFTGGPHAAYGSGSAWAALDFGPPDVLGSCYYSTVPLTAVAGGQIFLGSKGETYLDLDADGNLQTGWVLLYLHMVADDALTQGQIVQAGHPLGYASCEGGISDSSHLHLARRYNGEWMAADGPAPMLLSGWRAKNGLAQYEGTLIKGGEVKEACECWDEEMNALIAE
ncbi:MAG TPA: LysM peptidoglycan-binding domain-containing protein [Chloroflexi bacterium]|nr:LysM peptidoglycan-binding domain-containing protein [Chloroflexota bacterium]